MVKRLTAEEAGAVQALIRCVEKLVDLDRDAIDNIFDYVEERGIDEFSETLNDDVVVEIFQPILDWTSLRRLTRCVSKRRNTIMASRLTSDETKAMRQLIAAVERLMELPPGGVGHIADHVGEYGTDGDGGAIEDAAVTEALRAIVDLEDRIHPPASTRARAPIAERPRPTSPTRRFRGGR